MGKPLAGKVAVVTGASRGIGRAIAERLVADGAQVHGTSTKPDGKLPAGCAHHQARFEDPASLESFAGTVAKLSPHILVNNVGVTKPYPFEKIEEAHFREFHRINFLAPMRLCKAAVPGMKRHGWGRIVNITSIWAVSARTGRAVNGATKEALDVMTASVAYECAAHGVLANSVAPNMTETEGLTSVYGRDQIDKLAESVPMKRLCKPEEVAAFVAWLAGPENTYITGQHLMIDGGFSRFC
ncbi:MAG: SDR family NAD(P)-dependent oxidoreductase [Alphaproteobacteria bacterium]